MSIECKERLVIAAREYKEQKWCRSRINSTKLWGGKRASGYSRLEARDVDDYGMPIGLKLVTFPNK